MEFKLLTTEELYAPPPPPPEPDWCECVPDVLFKQLAGLPCIRCGAPVKPLDN